MNLGAHDVASMRSSDADSMRAVLCNDGNGGVEKYNTRVVGRPAASLSILSHKMICKTDRCPSACQGATPRVGGPRAQGAFGGDFCILNCVGAGRTPHQGAFDGRCSPSTIAQQSIYLG